MQGHGPGGMGPGMMQHMGQGMGPGMGKGMMGHMGGGMGPGMMHGGAGPTQFDPARLETLKTELGITAVQEPAWTSYAATVQDAAAAMKTTREGINPDTIGKMSPQDRFVFVSKIREQAQKQFATVKTAAEELLATLDDTQKAKARQTLPGLALARARSTQQAWVARSTSIEAGDSALWQQRNSSPLDASNVQRGSHA